MEVESKEMQEVIEIGKKAPLPRPISRRDCKCGCGNEFQPLRKDQIYLNKQHADFGYNHGKRKRKNQEQNCPTIHRANRLQLTCTPAR